MVGDKVPKDLMAFGVSVFKGAIAVECGNPQRKVREF